MKYIINNSGIVLFEQGKPIKIEKSSIKYMKVIKAFDLPVHFQEEEILNILNESSDYYEEDGFVIEPNKVSYHGEELPDVLAQKIRSILEQGLPVTLFAKFWENLQKNPSSSSVRELYDFLAYKELPLTEDGCFLAYKGLNENYYSISGNKKTKVLRGQVDQSGRIFNGIGEKIEVQRWDVDDNRENHCSFGLHVGSLEYAQGFAQGKIIVVKVNPKDVVSVPTDYDCQKCRVCAYESVLDFEQEITAPIVDEEGEAIESEEKKEYSEFENRINAYLTKKKKSGVDLIHISSIQNSFSPEYPSRVRVIDAINKLGYYYKKDDKDAILVIL